LGTDNINRDVAAGMIHGTRVAMLVGIVAMSIATLIGIFFGALAGYFGDDRLKVSRIRIILNILAFILFLFYGFIVRGYALTEGDFLAQLGITAGLLVGIFAVANILVIPLKRIPFLGKKVKVAMDILVMRFIEIVNSVPVLVLILSVVAIIETPSLVYVMAIIGLVSWTGIAKFLRAELLRVRNLEYVEAAQAFGFSNFRMGYGKRKNCRDGKVQEIRKCYLFR
jgi:peptide/nickel transport system permease protein